jgi:hypothetical protein
MLDDVKRHQGAVDVHAMPPMAGKNAADYGFRSAVLETPNVSKSRSYAAVRRERKRRFQDRLVRAQSYLIDRRPAAYDQGDGFDNDGLPSAAFAGEDLKAGRKFYVEVVDNRKVRNAQLGEHATAVPDERCRTMN